MYLPLRGIFDESDEVPAEELKHCILLSLTYHSRKSMWRMLGGLAEHP